MRFRLSMLMALIYGVQGAFWPLLAVHLHDLGISGRERGWIFATLAMGSSLMPLGIGRTVDRSMAGRKMLAILFTMSSAMLAMIASGLETSAIALFFLFLVFWMITAPAFALSSTIALRNLADPARQFAGVRLWGTVGWMVVGWLVSGVMAWSGSSRGGLGTFEAFWIASAIAMVVAIYSLTLPETPPLAIDAGRPGGMLRDAIELARRPGMTGFLLTAFGVHLTTPFVYQVLPTFLETRGLSRAWVPSVMTLGQWPEVAMLAVLPWMFRRIGPGGTLAIGIGAWVIRYGSLALNPPLWVAVAGIPLQGVGTACFTVAGQVYMDGRSSHDRRAGAQALYMVITGGLGSFAGSIIAGEAMSRFSGRYPLVFLVPCVIDLTLFLAFCAAMRPAGLIGTRPESAPASQGLRSMMTPEPAEGS